MRKGVVVVALAVLPLAPLSPAVASDEPLLVGTVGPGFTIGLKDAKGEPVVTLTPGRYHLIVHDLSSEHNFVMADEPAGRKFVIQTEVPFVGDASFDLDLTAGNYAYACAPHFETMNGRFLVLTPLPPAPKKLSGAVTAAGRATLTPRNVAAGRYRLTVRDRSKARGFRLVGVGAPRTTARKFVGAKSWTFQLRRGTYRFGTDRRLTGKLVVS
jgi:hypothetical protein